MQNKTKQQLKQIIKDNREFKNRTYWAAWNALNEMYNRGDA
jgi:hypothetical protein|tara:strand:- start:791 stop:913 length:123 start_codon:yes stop_codon:yes gene_type:complete